MPRVPTNELIFLNQRFRRVQVIEQSLVCSDTVGIK